MDAPRDGDAWMEDGCGRCDRYRTPSCKVRRWADVLRPLRAVCRASGLEERIRWGQPCYAAEGRNVALISAFNDYCALSFFQGALLSDPHGLLERPGPNSRAARRIRFTEPSQVFAVEDRIAAWLREGAELARSGARVPAPAAVEPVPEELRELLDADPELAEAFDALTPGRRRSHALYVAGARQAATRRNRAARCAPKILAGKGFHER